PEDVEPSLVDDRRHLATGDLDRDLLPRAPDGSRDLVIARRASAQVPARAVVVRRWIRGGSAEQVEDVVAVALVVVGTSDLERRDLLYAGEVRRVRVEHILVIDLGLEQGLLEVLEQRRLVVAEARVDVVLGPKEDFAVRLPG